MKVNIVFRGVVWEVLSCYCPHAERSVNEKEEFYELMDKVVISDICSDMGGFGEVHGVFEIGQINDGGI